MVSTGSQSSFALWDKFSNNLVSSPRKRSSAGGSRDSEPGSNSSRSISSVSSAVSSNSSSQERKSLDFGSNNPTTTSKATLPTAKTQQYLRWAQPRRGFSSSSSASNRRHSRSGFKFNLVDYLSPSDSFSRLAKAATAAAAAATPSPSSGSLAAKLNRAYPKSSFSSPRQSELETTPELVRTPSRSSGTAARIIGACTGTNSSTLAKGKLSEPKSSSRARKSVKRSDFWPDTRVQSVGKEITRWLKNLAN